MRFIPILASLAISSLTLASPGFAADQPLPPNVLFIAIDDLKPLLGCYGEEDMHTPNIDRLAEQGLVFLNNQCQQAVCGPSRASLLTGLRPDTTKVWDLKTRARDINPDLVTLPQHFRESGYTTVGYGKIEDPRTFNNGESGADATKHDPQSWDFYDRADRGGDPGRNKDTGKKPAVWSEEVPDNYFMDGAMAELAVERLGQLAADEKPFFLAVGFKKPHLPFVAPKKYWDLYERQSVPVEDYQDAPVGAPDYAMHNSSELRSNYEGIPASGPIPADTQRELNHGYRAAVSYIDAQVGMLLDEMESLDLQDNTIVILWGDHGFHLGDHGLYCKHSNFEQATRSPLIISTPNQKSKGTTTISPSEFVDIFPTLCDLAGLPKPSNLEGTSLVPILNDPSAVVKVAAMSQYRRGGGNNLKMGYAYRTPRYRFVAWTPFDAKDRSIIDRELYDYEVDPQEKKNLADDPEYAAVLNALEELHTRGWQGLAGTEIPEVLK